MKPQKIVLRQAKRDYLTVTDEVSFQYRPDRAFPLLQKGLFAILKILKCYRIYTDEQVKYITLDPGNILENIQRQRNEILKLAMNHRGRIYIGPDDLDKLMQRVDFHQISHVVDFTVDVHTQIHNRRQILGLPFTVVPWMSGVLVVPGDRS